MIVRVSSQVMWSIYIVIYLLFGLNYLNRVGQISTDLKAFFYTKTLLL
jgi:hypothetical protein